MAAALFYAPRLMRINGLGNLPFDRWFRYPAGFNRDLLDECFGLANLHAGAMLVDPFAGVGSAGTAALSSSVDFVGIEAHPLVAELAALKFRRPAKIGELLLRAEHVASIPLKTRLRLEPDLIRRSFAPKTLRRLATLREAIKSLSGDVWFPYLKWALLSSLRDCASVQVKWPYQRPALSRTPRLGDPVVAFLDRVRCFAEDLATHDSDASARIVEGDARSQNVWMMALGQTLADAVITSPPYLNNFDYADATRLELYFWGETTSWFGMTQTVRREMITATTQQSRKKDAQVDLEALMANFPAAGREISHLAAKLRRLRRLRPSGKEYDQVLPSYFWGIARVLQNILGNTNPNSPVLMVLGDSAPYGVYIDTPGIIERLALDAGFAAEAKRVIRPRGTRWRTNGMKHQVALREELLVLVTP